MSRIKYLKTVEAAERVVTTILTREKPVVAVKCFGINIGDKGGQLTLVAVNTWDDDVYVFDVKLCPAIMFDGGLQRMLQSVELLKVFHDCGPDSAVLHRQFGVKINHFFDTQIANSILMESKGLSPRRVPIQTLSNIASYTPSKELQQLLRDDPNIWARRPVKKDMLNLVASYVTPLVPELFRDLDSDLPEDSRDWFTHLCEENRLSFISNKRPGSKSKTRCPPNKVPSKSLHLIPLTDKMHFCL